MKEKMNNKELEEKVEINDYVVIDLTEIKSNVTYRYSYQIVSDNNLEKRDNYNKVSVTSPLGSKLLSGKIGDEGKYNVHEYHYKYNIIDIIKNKEETLNQDILPKTKIRKK